jgi:hypothetical protein
VDRDHDAARAGGLLGVTATIGAVIDSQDVGAEAIRPGGTVWGGREACAQCARAIAGEVELQAVAEGGDARRSEVGEQIEGIKRVGLGRASSGAVAGATVARDGCLGAGMTVLVSSRALTLQ